jgi:AcrR family transcriptional regulator
MTRRKPAGQRKAEILEATMRLADEVGPDRLTADAIARAVGLTQPGIFRHFPTKQAIWQAVAEAITGRMTDAWDEVLGRPAKPVNRLAGLIQAQLRLIRATPAIPAILFSRELHVENDGLRKTFLALMGRFHRSIAGEVRRAQDTGAFRPDLDADDVAFLLIGLVQGLAVRWSLSGRAFALEAEGARLLSLQIGLLRAPSAASIDTEALA